MKWILLVLSLLAVVPLGSWLRANRRYWYRAWTVVGFLPFAAVGWLDINLISHEAYRGDSRGFEITLVDLLVVALYLGTARRGASSPFRAPRYLYLLAAVFSVSQAVEPLFAWFSIWKLLRMYLVLGVVTLACADRRVAPAILRGMALGVVAQLPVVLLQRYGFGFYQTPGFFAHQNTLGGAVNLVVPVSLALILAGTRSAPHLAALAASPVLLVLSLSRGSITNYGLALGATLLLSTLRGLTGRKLVVSLVGVALVGAIGLKAAHTIVTRFLEAPEASAETRLIFEDAAASMLRDHPLGIGMNQYSLVIREGGYGQRAGEARGVENWNEPGEFGGIVHNIYWLTAAELGYVGIAAFAWLILSVLYLAFRTGLATRGDVRADVLLGLGVGIAGLCVHGLLEWTLRQTSISYVFWIMCGLVAALARQLREVRAPARRSAPGAPGPRRASGPWAPGRREVPGWGASRPR